MWIQHAGGRKFVLAVLICISALVLTLTGKMTFDQLQTIWLWSLGIFATTNAGQKIADKAGK